MWADDRVDDGWDDGGGDFAGYAAADPAHFGESAAGAGSLWEAPQPFSAGGLTPLAGGLVQAPKQRQRMKVRCSCARGVATRA